jgi:XTP/dITP diphosphohydrolase
MARRLEPGTRVIIATHNRGKFREIVELLAPYRLDPVSAGELGLPEPEETAGDFVGNARLKALAAAGAGGDVALADDSGFSLAALRGAPGLYSARWGGPAKDFALAMRKVAEALGDHPDRRAWFSCALSLAWPDGETASFFGRVEGHAVWPPRGERGFGYDPMFVPLGADETFGEMEPARKHAISHRARAFEALAAACLPLLDPHIRETGGR